VTRTELDRVRASSGIVTFALQQIEDELTADSLDAPKLAAILRELHDEVDPASGVLGRLAQLLTHAANRAEQLEPEQDGDFSCPLHEASALVTDNAGERIHWATRALDPEGERA
jgi:hypothetical protein